MSTRNIVVLAAVLVAAGIALTLILGRESEAAGRSTHSSQERRLDPSGCIEPVRKMFWRMTPIA
jgi:hypothetical protein